jgi:recombination protein RecA
MPRLNAKKEPKQEKAGAYFKAPASSSSLQRFSSGCALLDNVLGGGWVLGRMENIIGDKSTSKTGLAVEAMANFARAYPKGWIKYREAEAAFDVDYAVNKLGLPRARVGFWADDYDPERHFDTIEDMYEDVQKVLDKAKPGQPGLYIVDSLDALTDREEQKRKIDQGSYGGNKAKKLGEFFRRLVRPLEEKQVCLMIISQVRANIGAMFGEKYTRTGGKAMDFYATHCLWLAHLKTLKKTRNKVDRAVGIHIKAKCKKNKAGRPFREAEFDYMFDYGIDDLGASLAWLHQIGRLKETLGVSTPDELLKQLGDVSDDDYRGMVSDVSGAVKALWEEIERDFDPQRKKYA